MLDQGHTWASRDPHNYTRKRINVSTSGVMILDSELLKLTPVCSRNCLDQDHTQTRTNGTRGRTT